MAVWRDCWGTPVRVTEERLGHVLERPEMFGAESRMAETLAEPDMVVQSRSDSDVRLYHRFYDTTIVGAKHLCLVVKWRRDDAFMITAYFTDRPKQGTALWTKP